MSALRSVMLLVLTGATLFGAAAWRSAQLEAPAALEILPVLQADGPRWYKGNLHTHSLWSDGDDFPEMIADWYKRQGYNFLGLSDHNVLSEGDRWTDLPEKGVRLQALAKYKVRFGAHWVEEREVKGKRQVRLKPLPEFRSLLEEPGKFLLIPAEEVTHAFAKAPVHINAINLRDVIKPLDGKSITETISVNHRMIAEQGKKTKRRMLAFLNHPNYQWGVRAEDMIQAEELRFFEVYNGHPGVRNEGDAAHPSCERLWDIVLALRLGKYRTGLVYGLATDDSHAYHVWGVGKTNPGRGWVMVRAPYLSGETMIRGLEAGDFYATTGVVLESLKTSKTEMRVKVRAEKGVTYRIEFIATLRDASLASSPRLDKDGKEMPVTRVYSADIGKVMATSPGPEAAYTPRGDELYVRARIVSDKPHPNPYKKGDTEMAWVQPVAIAAP